MNKGKINRKIGNLGKGKSKEEYLILRKEGESKRRKGEIVTILDYHPSGHIRHGK